MPIINIFILFQKNKKLTKQNEMGEFIMANKALESTVLSIRMECSKIRLITIQPNLDLCSIYETTIEKMLHDYDFGL